MDENKHNNYSSKYLCKLLVEYRKPLLIIMAVAALCAIIFSAPFFITPLYKSTTIIYPTSSNSISKVLISTTYQSEKDIMNFGEDEQTEQMLQVLNSNRVRDKVISRFNLMEHYKIKGNTKYPITKLNKLYMGAAVPPTIYTDTFEDFSAELIVPLGAAQAYRDHEFWGRFANIKEEE